MYAVDVDPEVKGRVLEFVRERGRVTIENVRAEFFPDEMGAPYLYLDRLTAEGNAYSISPDYEPTQWFSALGRRERRGTSLRKRRAKDQAKRERQALEVTKAEEPSVDPELLDWVREFIYQRESVSLTGVIQEFFPGDSHTAQRYLSALDSEGAIESPDSGQTYEWAYPESANEVGSGANEPRIVSHKDCTHSMAQGERAKCRKRHGVPLSVRNQPRGHIYFQFADGDRHELTAEQIREIHGGTVDQFASCLRSYATNHAMRCSAQKTGSGLVFRFFDVGPTDISVEEYLPRDVVVKDRLAEPRKTASTDLVCSPSKASTHKDCTHPKTPWDRAKCRKARAAKAAA